MLGSNYLHEGTLFSHVGMGRGWHLYRSYHFTPHSFQHWVWKLTIIKTRQVNTNSFATSLFKLHS